MALHFNTLRYVETLQSTSISEQQAKAKVEALAMVLDEWAPGLLATRDNTACGQNQVRTQACEVDACRQCCWCCFIGDEGIFLSLSSTGAVAGGGRGTFNHPAQWRLTSQSRSGRHWLATAMWLAQLSKSVMPVSAACR